MKIGAKVVGSLLDIYDKQQLAMARGTRAAIKRSTTGLKNEMRRQVRKAGMGDRAANTWRGDIYPARKATMNAVGHVYSKSLLMKSLSEGEVIRAQRRQWLAIPSQPTKQGRNSRRKPSDYPAGAFDFIPTSKPDVARLVWKGTNETMFVLVKQVRIPKVLDFDRATAKWLDKLPGYLVAEIDRAERRIFKR